MVPTGRELVWFGLGALAAMFVWPMIQGALARRNGAAQAG
jgi:hypothetical protein